ncbi:MAG: hypothetical protein ACM3X0_01125 [Bacteroidota bacterium]
MCPFQRRFLPLLLIAVLPCISRAESAAELYAQARETPVLDQCIRVDIDLTTGFALNTDQALAANELTYPMAFNNIAEGWSWQPAATPDTEDYYRYKFLPLASEQEERGEYLAEDQIGEPQVMKVRWRYDYFLAFDNLYDFYPRNSADNAGFTAHLAQAPRQPPAMRALACLQAPMTSESTTFWKATHGQPVDFTLKKRYLIAKLQELEFVDRASGQILAIIKPSTSTLR